MSGITNPALAGRPVILVHLESPAGSGLTACSGDPFQGPDVRYPSVPLVSCIGCDRALERQATLRTEVAMRLASDPSVPVAEVRRFAESVEPAAPAEEKVVDLMGALEESVSKAKAAKERHVNATTYHLVIEANGPFFTGTLAETGKEFKGMSKNDVREKVKAHLESLGGEFKLVVR